MEARYSNLPYILPDLIFDPLPQEQIPSDTEWRDEGGIMARKTPPGTWINTLWALITHCVLSVGVAIFVLVFVADHHFNVTERASLVQMAEGAQVAPFLPMQSDIVTLLSSIIAVLKCILAAWAASLCWNIALFLMERRGLSRRNLKALLKCGLLTPSTYRGNWPALVIGALLLASLVANLSSPILTGSISWVPSNRLVHGLPTRPIESGDVLDGDITRFPTDYYNNSKARNVYVLSGVGRINLGWGRDTDRGVVKRVTSLVETLAINSTVENMTLPYFQVHSIRWIENRDEIPEIRDGVLPTDILTRSFQVTPGTAPGFAAGSAVLVPDINTNWSSDPLNSTIIHDTRLLILFYAWDSTKLGIHVAMTQDLPSKAFIMFQDNPKYYFAFAWVTFSAGVGRCEDYNCAAPPQPTIQNNTPIRLEPHTLTFQALSMAPDIATHLFVQNSSLPYMWDNLNDYVEAVLVRSYSGAWADLNQFMAISYSKTNYVPSSPSLLARVNHSRVYAWLGIQLLITLLSTLFLITQHRLSNYPWVGDTSLTAFHLDTTGVPIDMADRSVTSVRKIEQQGDRLKAKVE